MPVDMIVASKAARDTSLHSTPIIYFGSIARCQSCLETMSQFQRRKQEASAWDKSTSHSGYFIQLLKISFFSVKYDRFLFLFAYSYGHVFNRTEWVP